MTHLTPEEDEMVQHLRQQSKVMATWRGPMGDETRYHRFSAGYALAADAIEQRAALAGQVVVLTEALKEANKGIEQIHDDWLEPESWNSSGCGQAAAQCLNISNAIEAALDLPQVAQHVAEWKERAELLEWYDQNPSRVRKQFGHWWVFNIKGETIGIPFDTPLPALRAAKEASDEEKN